MSNKSFISLENEIDLRRSMRAVYKNEGWAGIYQCMGELAQSLQIIAEIAQDISDEEKKKENNNGK